ncbi:Uncharacterised protein [Mycobacteroides abscessus subsp. abscessus]|nr:Uncharacterised protein [Mycobacteroides abscessus subsp. abscessus]
MALAANSIAGVGPNCQKLRTSAARARGPTGVSTPDVTAAGIAAPHCRRLSRRLFGMCADPFRGINARGGRLSCGYPRQ